ncbi:MarR family winged helix-turn-helix transcriptional regulator [Marinobacterium rhizophilum]|uniref:MarR family winged helix-turn-helix transcriptional regulator n=1 Tax=Marinobacterium rhizophilum TaxID=420402 RepID=UPI0003685F6E|nr:MarR family transcriptional regulator [Marinobacterium rhizophilum]
MTTERRPDAVDAILAQWQQERPDLDVSPMATIGRLKRCSALMQRRLDEAFSKFGLTFWEFDMLATLRRSGAPYCLAPTALFSTLMVTSGTMTHRMQRLEASGWVERIANPDDARSKLVRLTPAGLELIDRAVEAHVQNEHQILAPLSAADRSALEASLTDLLAVLEPGGE